MSERTSVRFCHNFEIWPVIDTWASANGFKIKEHAGPERLYQKGSSILGPPRMLKIRQDAIETVIEAWIRINNFMRMMSFFSLPSEMGIDSGGYLLWSERKSARKVINKLLLELGQELIL